MNPYSNLDGSAFWKSGVERASPFQMQEIYQKKWAISPRQKIAAAGSCFAQHISRYLNESGYNVLNVEPTPGGLSKDDAMRFGYSMYSARYGNIYTLVQLLQILRETNGVLKPNQKESAWQRTDGSWIDAFRPGVEPDGLKSPKEVIEHRNYHINQVRKMFLEMDVFVFTMGLTEAWENRNTGLLYPSAPGVFAGEFNTKDWAFKNLGFMENINAFQSFHKELMELRGAEKPIRYILTVSPVPLTATATGKHVLSATSESKAILRSVAGQLANDCSFVDYFPSYEIITNQAARSAFYDSNLRTVRKDGVESVMRVFFNQHPKLMSKVTSVKNGETEMTEDDIQCEEAVLGAFAK